MNHKLLAPVSLFGLLALQACNELEFDHIVNITDRTGATCKSVNPSHNKWTDCYQDKYKSSCKNGKAVVCGNLYTNFEVFEYDCDCKMVDGKATCGECNPGEKKPVDGGYNICNPAGQWEFVKKYTEHPSEYELCDAADFTSSCENNVSLNCSDLTGRIDAIDCNNWDYYGRKATCVVVKNEINEYNKYTRLCETTKRRSYCAECRPGEVANSVCTSFYSVTTAPVICSEYGFWIDKETGSYPQTTRCDNGCTEGKCLGNPVGCTPGETKDHVCYTEDSFVLDSVTCMTDGKKWADFNESLRIQYCTNGCKDNQCL